MTDPVRGLVSTVGRTVASRQMLRGGETVLVAVSGGPDSLALLHALGRLGLGLRLHVAHFDHRLREDSGRDAAFVARRAGRLGLPVTLGADRTPVKARGLSPEEAARERRLAFLGSVADAVGADRIATGHTKDDQAETVLMRMILGAGRRGLGGIPPVRDRFVRPLIDCRREHTVALCRALRLRPMIDPTNADPAYMRNAIRRDLLPLLEGQFNARIVDALARSADVLRDEDAFLDELAAAALPVEGSAETPAGEVRLPLDALLALPVPLQRRVIRRIAPLGAEATERVRVLAAGGATGESLNLPARLNARVEYGFLVIGRVPSPMAPPQPADLAVPGETDLPSWGRRVIAWIETGRPVVWPDGRSACVMDADRISLPLRVRRCRPGDRFRPLGMARQKKVGDFFTDEKVPRAERARTPLVVDAKDEPVWVVGHRIDDRAKVGESTQRFLGLRMEGSEAWSS